MPCILEEMMCELKNEPNNVCALKQFEAALPFVRENKTFRTVDLQRHLACGYGTVARVIDALLSLGVIEKTEGETPYRSRIAD